MLKNLPPPNIHANALGLKSKVQGGLPLVYFSAGLSSADSSVALLNLIGKHFDLPRIYSQMIKDIENFVKGKLSADDCLGIFPLDFDFKEPLLLPGDEYPIETDGPLPCNKMLRSYVIAKRLLSGVTPAALDDEFIFDWLALRLSGLAFIDSKIIPLNENPLKFPTLCRTFESYDYEMRTILIYSVEKGQRGEPFKIWSTIPTLSGLTPAITARYMIEAGNLFLKTERARALQERLDILTEKDVSNLKADSSKTIEQHEILNRLLRGNFQLTEELAVKASEVDNAKLLFKFGYADLHFERYLNETEPAIAALYEQQKTLKAEAAKLSPPVEKWTITDFNRAALRMSLSSENIAKENLTLEHCQELLALAIWSKPYTAVEAMLEQTK